ncbi:hypothetical protein [Microbacterium sp. NPDC087665]|uniref:hypothetical protein n=1 Tax=Microbacterium sp. NPDC087665 TaxID=3364194 RepID=UPI0038044B83
MKRYVGFGIMLLILAGVFLLFAAIAFGLAGGDLFADVEYTIPRKRRRGDPSVVVYPAFVTISAALSYAVAIALSGIAHIRGSKAILVLSSVVGVVAAVAAIVTAFVAGVDTGSRTFAVFFAVVAIALALYVSIKTLRDARKDVVPAAGDHRLGPFLSGPRSPRRMPPGPVPPGPVPPGRVPPGRMPPGSVLPGRMPPGPVPPGPMPR